MNNWRLVADSVGYLVLGTHDLYLAAIEKKEFTSAVIKQIGGVSYKEIPIKDDGISGCKFLMKFKNVGNGHLLAFVKSDELPNKEEWYEVKNMYEPHILDILTSEKVEGGEVKDAEFEVIFSESFPGNVSFASTKSALHKECMAELTRRLNFEFCKKTRKRIPGHRYDTADSTYYYLGTFNSHKKGNMNSPYFPVADGSNKAGLYVKQLRPDEKSVADVLKSRSLGTTDSDIIISYSPNISAADAGEAITAEKDYKIEDYWEPILENTIKKTSKIPEFGGVLYRDPKYIFDILALQTGEGELPELPENIRKSVETVIKNILHQIIIKFWELTTYTIGDNSILSKNPLEKNINHLVNIFFSRLPDENVKSAEYYDKLFKAMKININKLAEEELNGWDLGTRMTTDLSYYMENLGYVTSRKRSDCVQIMDGRAELTLSGLYRTEDGAVATNLVSAIKDIFDDAKTNYGEKVATYSVTNMGTKKNPLDHISCGISIYDLINYFGGIEKVPKSVGDEIMAHKFHCVNIYIDSNKELQ